MKRLAFLLASLFISISAFSQMVRKNPIEECRITKHYGLSSETFYLSGDMHIVTNKNEFAEFKVYIAKPNEYADLIISWQEHPVECGEWHITTDKGFGVRFVTNKEDAHFIVKFGDTKNAPSYRGIPY